MAAHVCNTRRSIAFVVVSHRRFHRRSDAGRWLALRQPQPPLMRRTALQIRSLLQSLPRLPAQLPCARPERTRSNLRVALRIDPKLCQERCLRRGVALSGRRRRWLCRRSSSNLSLPGPTTQMRRQVHFKRVSRSQSRCWFRRTGLGLCGWSRGPRTGCRPSPCLPSPAIPSSPPPESAGSRQPAAPCPQDHNEVS